MDSEAKTFIWAGTLVFSLIYFAPVILAFSRHKKARMIILVVSVFLFLSTVVSMFWLRNLQDYVFPTVGVGWLVCMIWVWVGGVKK